ncbi:hypothetical protein GYB29_15190 [bacterium]|nr:hypothetical protein [bacterium]
MNTREEIHNKIDELLGQISLHNNRISLHDEKISQLDVDVLRKHCIDLYDQVNMLVLASRKSSGVSKQADTKQVEASEPVEETVKEAPKAEVKPEPLKAEEPAKVETKQEEVKEEPKAKVEEKTASKPSSNGKKSEGVDEEMVSLFERYNSKPIDDISKAITISKRFEFQNNFFDGDAAQYKAFIKAIDDAGDRESAFEIYHEHKNRLSWENEDLKDELKSLLYRKYNT